MDSEGKRNFLYVVGISHACADAETVGACGVPKESADIAEKMLMDLCGFSETLVLSTCNRVEIYFVSDSENAVERAIEAFGKVPSRGRDIEKFAYLAYAKKNVGAIEHIFEVASGLQSQMTGETEILGQVKAAYARAAAAGHCKSVLNTVFQKANQCAKWVRTNTNVGHGKISLGSVSAELADRIFGDVARAKILLLGSGEAGRLVADALFVRGAKDISVASRTRANADRLAAQIGVESADLEQSLANLPSFDIVIAASFSPVPLIGLKRAKAAAAARGGRPIFLIDLAVPRNIDKACGEINDVYLYNLDDLSRIANENIALRKNEIEAARKEIQKKAQTVLTKLTATELRSSL